MTDLDALRRTENFYDWEILGRGWLSYDYLVALEPEFRPFAPWRNTEMAVDDGRTPSLFSRLGSLLGGRDEARRIEPPPSEALALARPLDALPATAEWDVLAPEDFKPDESRLTSWLQSIAAAKYPITYTVIGAKGRIAVSLSSATIDSRLVSEQTTAHFPSLRLRASATSIAQHWGEANSEFAGAVEFALAREFMLPFVTGKSGVSIFTPIVGALAQLDSDEVALYQIAFERVSTKWNHSAIRSVQTENGNPFFADAEYITDLALKKCSEPMFAVGVRIAVGVKSRNTAETVLVSLCNTLGTFGSVNHNEITPLPVPDVDQLIDDVLKFRTHRPGSILSLSELRALIELPHKDVVSTLLVRSGGRSKRAPDVSHHSTFSIGMNEHEGILKSVGLSNTERLKHCYLIGASGTGKSSQLLNMIEQDLEIGNGLAVLDPHGDLIDEVLSRIPDNRIADVIVFDPADSEFPVGFNVLQAHSELEKTVLSSDLVSVFRRFSSSFGDQMETVLANAILAFLERPEGGTLLTLRQFLLDKAYRDQCLRTVKDREVVEYWRREFPLLRGNPQASILTRLNGFLRPRTIRNMVAQQNSGIDMRSIMDGGRVLLAKLSQGMIGEENAYLLGSLLVTQISQAAAARQDTRASVRREFFLYMDEFHHFITPSITTILSGARKYGLGLTLAHQDLRQIKSRDDNLLSSVLGNAYTRIMFRVGEDDAKTLASGLSFFEAKDLQNLGIGECIARVERPNNDFNLRTHHSSRVDEEFAAYRKSVVVEISRRAYAKPRSEVESLLEKTYANSDITKVTHSEGGLTPKTRAPRASKKTEPNSSTSNDDTIPGRGGPQHKYLQSLVAKLGNDRGFVTAIEQRVLNGHGHVDVSLKRSDIAIAFEISVTNRIEYEVANLTKCLVAGFDLVVLLCEDAERLAEARRLSAKFQTSRIRFLLTDQVTTFFDEFPVPVVAAPSVKRTFKPNTSDGERARQSAITRDGAPVGPKDTSGRKTLMIARAAATYLGLAQQTLAKLRVVGGSPPYFKVGRQVMYDLANLDAWLSERRKRSTSE